jgi:hypothetical protein
VSLPTDIIQLFGTSSVPVIVAGSVLGVFELGERFASQRAKDALSKWLLSFDIQKAKALPDGTQELFQSIFGERHFSWKCFIRSVSFSCGAIAFIGILALLINPHLIKAAIVLGWTSLAEWPPLEHHHRLHQSFEDKSCITQYSTITASKHVCGHSCFGCRFFSLYRCL